MTATPDPLPPAADLAAANLQALHGFLPQAQSRAFGDFIRYVISIHPADRLPGREAFDPIRIPALLPGIVLVQVDRSSGAARFLTKVAGENVLIACPAPMLRRYIDEVVADIPGADSALQRRQAVLDCGHSVMYQGRPLINHAVKMMALEYCHCPLASDGATIDYILSYFQYTADT